MAAEVNISESLAVNNELLDQLLPTLSEEDIVQYRDEHFPQDSLLRQYARVDNPREWIDADTLVGWLVGRLQTRANTPRTPSRLRTFSGPPTLSTDRGRSRTPRTPSAGDQNVSRSVSRSSGVSSVPESVLSSPRDTVSSSRSRSVSPFPQLTLEAPSSPNLPAQTQYSARRARASSRPVSVSDIIEISSDSDDDVRPPPCARSWVPASARARSVSEMPPPVPFRRIKQEPDARMAELALQKAGGGRVKRKQSDVSPDTNIVKRPSKQPRKPDPGLTTSESIVITRQRSAQRLITLTSVPKCWTVPRDGTSTAYLLDLRGSTLPWTRNGNVMSMVAIIKSEDQDAWGNGTGGSATQTYKVRAFGPDPVECRYAEHICQGIYACSRIDPALLDGCERYEPREEDQHELAALEHVLDTAQTASREVRATMFWTMVTTRKPCGRVDEHGRRCNGAPVYRVYRDGPGPNGKAGFVGCRNWEAAQADSGKHRYVPLPADVDDDLVQELSRHGGVLTSASADLHAVAKCARMVSPRSGGKGSKECPYSHVVDGKAVIGKLIKRPCTTRIRIWYPADLQDRRAIVLLEGAHNHPTPRFSKVSYEGKMRYQEAIESAGVMGATVARVDRAQTTSNVFNGQTPVQFDPALGNMRKKRELVQKVKQLQMPHGNGLEGVVHQQQVDLKTLQPARQYIQLVAAGDVPVIVTFIPFLVAYIHTAWSTSHDNTYKRLAGEWKEWEIVIWLAELNMRVTIARVYCVKEDRHSFHRMWMLFFETVARVTGKPVLFDAFSGGKGGIRSILVDGCKPQIDALGDFLVKQNDPTVSGIYENDPQQIVEYLIKLCSVHYDRNVTKLVNKGVSQDAIKRIRDLPHIKTQEDLTKFKRYCETSKEKAVRDWYSDKLSAPWFYACINKNFSRMDRTSWDTTPNTTNMNESAHVLTNLYTGIGLPLFEAIQRYVLLNTMQ
ncbi:hypothetical protein L226DRAFT_570087 [Lentinus tigrinus ALCF2SS1-7]|uniref:uncharacterized protein n=1 Tax=Lentinus tigrinus ALCF2SS1-7 TaxID=1328758 RepID=UPI0011662740|nr:hypothetical protein L226DRAFT_570087 [Lentinus tigrinus ALCF2SS1-7]